MKKQNQRSKKRRQTKRGSSSPKQRQAVNTGGVVGDDRRENKENLARPSPSRLSSRKEPEKRGDEGTFIFKYIAKAGQFLREARMELKKVKWPSRKELLSSTGVVIILVLMVALFLGLVDFGLIKLIRNIVG